MKEAGQRLVEAFLAVQKADLNGISLNDSRALVNELNTALSLEQSANSTGSVSNATLSTSISSQVLSQAESLQNEAQARTIQVAVLVYSAAFWIALLTSLLMVEFHRIPNFLRKRRLFRNNFETGARKVSA